MTKRNVIKQVVACFICLNLLTPVSFSQQLIPILSKSNALILQVSPDSSINMIYFGVRISDNTEYKNINSSYRQGEDYSQVLAAAYPSSGSRNLTEPAITVTHEDGNQSLDLRFVSTQTQQLDNNVSIVSVLLKDPVYDFRVQLFYRVYFEEDVIEQWSSIQHNEKGKVILHKYASANLYLKGDKFYLRQYHGNKVREMQPEESQLTHGIKTLDTKLGTRANMFMPSSFMISMDKPSAEDEGTVLVGTLAYSGNFRLDFELDQLNNLRIISGMNNYASDYYLKPKEKFETPALVYTLSDKGRGDASRQIHRWARRYKLLDGQGSRLTLLNNWEATWFNFNEPKLDSLLRDTKKLGVDLFLLDDGWFGNKYPRDDDKAALGDWQESKQKLPHGIGWLVQQAKEQQVKFGLWIEPEMVSPKSELYEQHPDWVVKQPNRKEHYYRNQLVLDLANPKVQDFIFKLIDDLFTKHPGLAYLKWDCNSLIYNAYSSYLKEQQSHFYIEYYRGLYSVLKKIRDRYPAVPMMLCSGGGGRVDYGALQYFTEYWPSDNTDPLERIFIQWEYSYFYPAISSANHVTDWGKQSLKFRTDVAMMGKLGFDIVVDHLNEKDLKFTQQAVQFFNGIKEIIWQGDQYRLSDPAANAVAAIMYVDSSRSAAVMFNYLVNNRYGQGSMLPVKLKGLDAKKYYNVTEVNLYPDKTSTLPGKQRLSGDFLMKIGINPDVRVNRPSVVLRIEEEK
jgi:alpha-galactosidase